MRTHYNTFLSTGTAVLRGQSIVSHKWDFYGDLFLLAHLRVCACSLLVYATYLWIPRVQKSRSDCYRSLWDTRQECYAMDWLSGSTDTSLNHPVISPLWHCTVLKDVKQVTFIKTGNRKLNSERKAEGNYDFINKWKNNCSCYWMGSMQFQYALTQRNTTQQRKIDILKFAGRLMDLENIILSDPDKNHLCSLISDF